MVRKLAHFEFAFRVRDHDSVRVLVAEFQDVLRLEHLVHRTMPFPQQNFGVRDLLRRQATHRLIRIPYLHPLQGNAHLVPAPAAQVLVREKQHFLAARERPVKDLAGIGRRAHDTAVFTAERLEIGGRIDVGDRRDLLIRIEHFGQFTPCPLDFRQAGHVGHRTTGRHVGENDDLARLAQNDGDFGHEVHAAKHDVLCIRIPREFGQPERVAGQIGMLVDVRALVVVAENDRAAAEFLLCRENTRLAVVILQLAVAVESNRGCGHIVMLPVG